MGRLRKAARVVTGLILVAAGAALIVYGGILADAFGGDGGHPDYLSGVALCVGGLVTIVPGLLLLGLVDVGEFLGVFWGGS